MDIVKSTITMVGDIQVQKAVAKELDNEDPAEIEKILAANEVSLKDVLDGVPVLTQEELDKQAAIDGQYISNLERVDENT